VSASRRIPPYFKTHISLNTFKAGLPAAGRVLLYQDKRTQQKEKSAAAIAKHQPPFLIY
jgi:hypothetical protein